MEDWAFSILEALNANQQLDMLHELGPKYGIDPEQITRAFLVHCRAVGHAQQHAVHAHGDPEPARLGLITERTAERLAQGRHDGRPPRHAPEVRAASHGIERGAAVPA